MAELIDAVSVSRLNYLALGLRVSVGVSAAVCSVKVTHVVICT